MPSAPTRFATGLHRRVVLTLAALLLVTATLSAQIPYGTGTPGSNGTVPTLSCDRARFGNLGFGFDITGAGPGLPVQLGVSIAPANLPVAGGAVLIDVTAPGFFLVPSFTTVTQGSARLPFPIPGTPSQPTVGLTFYTQALILDPAAAVPVLTRGLRVTTAAEESLFVGSSVGGSADPTWILEEASGTVFDNPRSGTDNVGDAEWGDSGRYAYVGAGLGNQIARYDRYAPVGQRYSTYYAATGSCSAIEIDRTRGLLYVLVVSQAPPSFPVRVTNELIALDLSSGVPIASSGPFNAGGGFFERLALSPDGRTALAVGVFPSTLIRFDTDPSSPTWLQPLLTRPIPGAVGSGFNVPTTVAFTRDGSIALIPIQSAGPDDLLARYEVASDRFLDHNPNTRALDHIGPTSLPPVILPRAPTGLAIARRGDWAAISGFGNGGSILRLDGIGDPNLVPTPTGIGTPGSHPEAWAVAISFDDDTVAVGGWQGSQAFVERFDANSGVTRGRISLPGSGGNVYTLRYF